MKPFVLLVLSLVVVSAQTCSQSKKLTALDLNYKSHEDHVLFGKLTACPREGEELSESLHFKIIDSSDARIDLDSQTGLFMFNPTEHYSGIEVFYYTVQDEKETSEPSKVIISMRSQADPPLLEVKPLLGYDDEILPVKIDADIFDKDGSESLLISFCDCGEELRCDEIMGRCTCDLRLPTDWQFLNNNVPLTTSDLHRIEPELLKNLKLSPGKNPEPSVCIDVHAVSYERQQPYLQQAKTTKQLHITVLPRNDPPIISFDDNSESVTLETSQGRPIRFKGLRITDSDSIGTYRVRATIDDGGRLFVEQQHPDVVFVPKDRKVRNMSLNEHERRELNRDDQFYDFYQPRDDRDTNNGKKTLEFIGTPWGINEVLSSMVYVPWCAKWPSPPNWNFPEDSWMKPSEWDEVLSEDERFPVIWPQWYPRFWYPFPSKTWYWWPRIWSPYWMDDVCSDWTTHLQVEVTEVTPSGCQPTEEQPEQRDEWSAYIHVESRSSPKSLITTNHFTYCPESETRQVVNINSLYIRALQSTDLRLRFNMRILEDVDAWVENSETGTPTFDCDDLDVCNERIQNIEVHFPHGNLDICKVTVEIELYKDKSERLADILTLWVYKTHPKCVETDHNYPDFRINTELVETRQGQIQDLHIRSSIPPEDVNGILHVKLRSEFGLVSIPRVPDSLRIYSDHMAVHESIPTKMCIAGPATLVLQALESTRFTPLKDFWGRTKVEIEYGVTTTAAKLMYGDIVPKKIVNQDVVVKNGYMPTLPLLSVPRRICADERQIKHMDMVKIIARFQEKDAVTVRIYTRMGELHLSRSIHHVELSDDMMEIMERDNKQIIIRSSISLVRGFIHDVILYETPECREDYQSSPIDQITVQIMSDNGELDQSTTIVDITCVESEEAVQDIVDIAENCEKKDMLWGPWSHCSADYCGVGLQYRERSCGEPDRDERRCVKCDCKPTPVLVRNPSAYLAGCESQEPLLQCPETCEPVKMRYANHEFLCKDKDTAWIQYKPIEVHEQCICKTCTSHRSYNPLS